MPPVFGILNIHAQRIDPDMISRMKEVAVYSKARRIESVEPAGGIMASAVVVENQMTTGKKEMAIIGDWAIAADAALYRREELIRRMERVEHGERGSPGDAELILEAWLKWGKDCVKYLYGDFAFVIFNQKSGEIFGGRDQMGVRPFFYAMEHDAFIFGSELRYVLASYKNKPVLRREYLLDTLVTIKTSKELSPFEPVFRLTPGHFLHISKGVANIQQYWKADPDKTIRLTCEEDYINLFREKLVKAVNMRCQGISNIGTELSGGLDSSAVTGIASDFAIHNNSQLTAYSNIFPEGTGIEFKDERKFISHMCSFKSFKWEGVDRLNLNIPELLKQAIDIQGCYTQQNYSIFNRGIYEAAGGRNIPVLLSGFGGDELVSARVATPWNEIIGERQWAVFKDELFYKGISAKTFFKLGIIAFRHLKSRIGQPRFRTGVFTPELLDRRLTMLPLRSEFVSENELRARLRKNFRKPWQEKTSHRQFDRIMMNHLPLRMEYCYTAAAQFGIEYRYPLLDLDLIETCLAFPPWIKHHHGINRYVFRQAIKDYVPEEIRSRDDKSGTTIPHMYYSLLNEKDRLLDLVNSCSSSLFLQKIFDFRRFPQWYEKLVKRDKADMNYLMPGAFYEYLKIMLYFRDKGQGTSSYAKARVDKRDKQ